jgi:endonuclease/exonuclease/phosphatase family metal-dependent hydrolase
MEGAHVSFVEEVVSHRRRLVLTLIVVAFAVFALAAPATSLAKHQLGVMTRNVYLGADLSPAINATSTNGFIDANGQILRDVDTNNFPVRAKGLADEILNKDPDLVGLQEVALWRTGPLNDFAPITHEFTASHVKYDYLQLLLGQLNAGPRDRYRVVAVQNEFDFEAPADYNGVAGDGDLPGVNDNGELNGRLTMRDVILAKTGGNVKTANAGGGHFDTLYTPVISGIPVTVQRGWTQVDARVRGSHEFRFVNTHLEAFGDPTIREAQAKELVAPRGPATGDLPVILVGDLNSDDDTVTGGDRLAYNALLVAGLSERSTANPLSCCLNTDILTANLGSVSDFNHQVDHVLTDDAGVTLLNSSVTGRAPVNGYWDSDHVGVFSELQIP